MIVSALTCEFRFEPLSCGYLVIIIFSHLGPLDFSGSILDAHLAVIAGGCVFALRNVDVVVVGGCDGARCEDCASNSCTPTVFRALSHNSCYVALNSEVYTICRHTCIAFRAAQVVIIFSYQG